MSGKASYTVHLHPTSHAHIPQPIMMLSPHLQIPKHGANSFRAGWEDGAAAPKPQTQKKQVPCLSAWDKKLLSRRLDIVVFDDTPPHLPGVGVGGIDDDGLIGTTSFLLAPLLTHRGCELSA